MEVKKHQFVEFSGKNYPPSGTSHPPMPVTQSMQVLSLK